jgi:two-component system sensor histidine kinase GlrK
MKIATRIISGYAILILLIALLIFYQVVSIHRMQATNRNIARVDFRSALASLQLMRDHDLVEEYAKKVVLVGDPAYEEQLASFREHAESTLSEIGAVAVSEREKAEFARLAEFWNAFWRDFSRHRAQLRGARAPEFPAELQDHLDRMRTQNFTVYQQILDSIAAQAAQSDRTGDRVEMISWFAAVVALVLSAVVSFLIVRSIAVPLANLTEGTRAIAAGKFYYRLDTSGTDEFAQVARDFNTMTERLGELNVLKREFVSHVSHELKAPLASMRETIQLILEGIPGPLNEKQRRLLELNLQSGRRLTSIVGNLLDMSKIEAGVMEYDLKNQELLPLVRAAIAEYEAQASEKTIHIETEMPDTHLVVECDGDRIIQVIGNVLSNAVKFSPRSGHIVLRVCIVPELPEGLPPRWQDALADRAPANGFAQITITDTGPGIPDPQKERVFEKFHQATPGKKLAGQGVGLGLAISRTVIQAHRGAIWVQDNPEGGSVFHLLLRLATTAEHKAAALA